MRYFWPLKTGITFYDVWTVAHLSFWIFVSTTFVAFGLSKDKALAISLTLALAWECFERVAEQKWPHIWQHPESMINAWLSDPLTAVLGIAIGYWLVAHQ